MTASPSFTPSTTLALPMRPCPHVADVHAIERLPFGGEIVLHCIAPSVLLC